MLSLLNRLQDNIIKNELSASGERILVALSGGPDSTCLLLSLAKLSRPQRYSLVACYIDHKIRPKIVPREIEFCRKLCRRLKVRLVVVEADIPKYAREEKLSLEEAGRLFRREALAHIAFTESCTKIATGHHQDDLVETILFRLLRGTGPQGLDPIKPKSGIFIRPLYNISKEDILADLKKHKAGFMLDRSNFQSDFSRNFIRNKLIPDIERRFGSGFKKALLNFADILHHENAALDKLARKSFKTLVDKTPGGKIIVALDKIRRYDLWLKRRLVKFILEELSGVVGAGSFEEVERVVSIMEKGSGAIDLAGEIRAKCDHGFLAFGLKPVVFIAREIAVPGTTTLNDADGDMKVSTRLKRKSALSRTPRNHTITLDFDALKPPLKARGIQPGDKIRPLGMTGSRKVGNILTDRKVPRFLRDEIPVILDREGIIWIAGIEIADRAKITSRTRQVLELKLVTKKSHGTKRV